MSLDETKMEPLPTVAAVTSQVEPQQDTVPVQPTPPAVGVRIRPKICDVRNCDANSLRNPDLLFVCVPGHSYPERRFVWLTLMQAVRDKKRSYCCSRHFKIPDDFKDFQEFISAPPGYKRQLLVKKGVVPHLNMPPLNMSALPPLTDRWPMTLPAGMTETEQLRHNAMLMGSRHNAAHPPPSSRTQQQQQPPPPRIRYSKGVQTESTNSSVGIVGPRKVPPSLQYCRLCFQKQDLEPIFTGDQTLIEPDLIDKIFGCTEIMISVESDFPSSICTGCYNKVHEYVNFRKLVQQNDKSLRGIPLPPINSTSSHVIPTAPRQNSFVRTKTTVVVQNRPTQKVTPIRPVNSTPPSSVQSAPVTEQRDDPLLEVQRIENVERYQRRQATIERNQPLRAQRVQDTFYPVPYRRPITEGVTIGDPLASADNEQKTPSDSEDSLAPEGVQLNDRVVPVTLIRVQPDSSENDDTNESQPVNTNPETSQDVTIKEEEPSTETSSEKITNDNYHDSPNNVIRPRPLHQMMHGSDKNKTNPPNVLQAVKLLPSDTAKALVNQKSSLKPVSTLTRGITSGRFPVHRIWNTFEKNNPKSHMARMLPKSFNRAVRLPGVFSSLIHRAKLPQSATYSPNTSNKSTIPKPLSTASSNLEKQTSSPQAQPKVQKTLTIKHSTPSPVPKPKAPVDAPKQKENSTSDTPSVPDVPSSSTKTVAKSSAASPVPEPKSIKPLSQTKDKDVSNNTRPDRGHLAVVLSKLPAIPSLLPIIPKPKPSKALSTPEQKNTNNIGTPSAPDSVPESSMPPSPRSSRVRKVPLKFQNTVGFPVPKVITVKSDPDSPDIESKKVPLETPKEQVVRVTRRSAVIEQKPADTPTDKKKPESREATIKSKPKENDSLKEPTRVTRRSDVAIAKLEEPQQRSKPPKRKSDAKMEMKDQTAPPTKSPKLADQPKTKKQPQQKPKQSQRANGAEQSASASSANVATTVETDPPAPTAKAAKPRRRQELERAKTPVSSQDWKCPFCTNKVFEEKKRLVKHLRKRHGMDYALVRQQLAIYGGNWRH
ncbi:uncharacterized protein LOC5580281 [Aedes aegypti]|uniref:Uncharacterized protein n=1 Tax=Aedes aegypti TaxID=7159 RepID=A0A6I8T808_AEDAE|nr:uncharacterized protein LOC5580281 [Aedes aegypti]